MLFRNFDRGLVRCERGRGGMKRKGEELINESNVMSWLWDGGLLD